jgi:hypothetical protein
MDDLRRTPKDIRRLNDLPPTGDLAKEARHQSLLASQKHGEADALTFIEEAAETDTIPR